MRKEKSTKDVANIDIDGMRKYFPTFAPLVLWLGPILLAVGFVVASMWKTFPAPRALEASLIAALALALGWVFKRLARIALATAIAAVFFVALIYFVGVMPMLSATLLLAAAFVIGRWITGASSALPALVAGIASMAGIVGWTLPFPVHYRIVYFLLLLIPAFIGRSQIITTARTFHAEWSDAVAASPRLSAFAVVVVGLASTGCWLPTIQYDDLAYHLGLPSQLAALHYYRMDVQSQIWALAPWSGDIVHAIAQMLAGTEARGAVDAMWVFLIAGLTWQLADALRAPRFACWLAVAMVASQPLLASLAGGMQAELPATAAGLALALTVILASRRVNLGEALRFALVAAFLVGLKTGFVAIVLPLSVWLYWRWRGQWTWRISASALAIFFAACASSYVYAHIITGDPFFPLFADAFHARFAADVLADTRWTAPVDATIPWQLTFATSLYHEGWNGAAGFSLLGLSGAIVVAIFARRSRALALCAGLAFIAAVATVHYFRYAFPALTILTVIAVVVASSLTSPRKTAALSIVLIALNIAYQSCALWTLHVGGVKHRLLHRDTAMEAEHFAPERSLIRLAQEQIPDANVLMCSPDDPFAAELAGRGFTASHYDPELNAMRIAANSDATGQSWRAIFARTNARYAIVSTRAPRNEPLAAALDDAQLVRDLGTAQLWKLPERKTDVNDFVDARDFARRKLWP
ncbi:MAG: hypothetical protein ABJB01_12005 [Rudaea sp.]